MGKLKSIVFGKDEEFGRKVYKETISMAWPSVLESFLINLTGFFDTIMVSSLGVSAVAAIGLTIQPKFIAICVFMALCISIASLVARRKGEKDRESATKILRMSLFFASILVLIISTICVVFADAIISFCGSQPDTHADAVTYFRIIMGGMIFTTTSLIINAAQRGAGKTRVAMVTNITSNVVNVIFNYLLIGGNFGFPKLGIAGAAYATVIGSIVACMMSIVSVLKHDSFVYIRFTKGIVASIKDIKSLLNVGTSAFIEQIFLRIGFLSVAMLIANLGTTAFGANQIGTNFLSLSFAVADGLSVASVALVGRSLGERKPEMAKKYSATCFKLGFVCSTAISLVLIFFGRTLFALFSNEPEVLDYGVMIMNVLSIAIFAQIFQVAVMGSLRGAGDTKYTALVSMVSVMVIRPVSSWLLCYPLGLGLTGIWAGLCIDQGIRCLLSFTRYKRGKWIDIKL